jgi:hypothetical protein
MPTGVNARKWKAAGVGLCCASPVACLLGAGGEAPAWVGAGTLLFLGGIVAFVVGRLTE